MKIRKMNRWLPRSLGNFKARYGKRMWPRAVTSYTEWAIRSGQSMRKAKRFKEINPRRKWVDGKLQYFPRSAPSRVVQHQPSMQQVSKEQS